MKAHIVVAHPEPTSLNARLAGMTREALSDQGFACSLSDLYAMGFDPCEGPRHYAVRHDAEVFHTQTEQRHAAERRATPADVRAELDRLRACDLLIVHFPLWWFGPPAILKGWIDRVFVYGDLYKSTRRYDAGMCAGKRMLACVTTGASADACSPSGREGDTRLHLWPVLYAFRYVGFDVLVPETVHGIGSAGYLEGREGGFHSLDPVIGRWKEALAAVGSRPAVTYNRDDDFDDRARLRPGAPVHSPFTVHASN